MIIKNKINIHENEINDKAEILKKGSAKNKKADREERKNKNKRVKEKKKRKKINVKNMTLLLIFLISVAILAAIAFFGILLVNNKSAWYVALDIPWEQPDDYVFLIAWGSNYVLYAASFFIALINRLMLGKVILSSYIVNLFLYVAWLSAFFIMHRVDVAFFTIIGMMITLYIIIKRAFKKKLICSILCMPYAILLVIMLCMNYVIVILN